MPHHHCRTFRRGLSLSLMSASALLFAPMTGHSLDESPSRGGNFLTNGSFELGLGAEPFFPGWRVPKSKFAQTPTPPLPQLDTATFHSGRQSLKLSRPQHGGIVFLDIHAPELPGKTPTQVTFWVKASRPDVTITAGICPADGKGGKLLSSITQPSGTDWQQMQFEVPPQTGPAPARIEASSTSPEPFEIWLDDIAWQGKGQDTASRRSGPVEVVLLPETRNGIRFADQPINLIWSADSESERSVKWKATLVDLARRETVVYDELGDAALGTTPAKGTLALGHVKRGAYLVELDAIDPLTGNTLATARERFTVFTNLKNEPAPVNFDVGYHGGIEFGADTGFSWRGYWDLDEFFAVNYQTGFRIQRDIWDWQKLQPLPETFDWKALDMRVEAADRNGCNTIICTPHSPLYLDRDKYQEILKDPALTEGRWIYKTATDISQESVRSAVMGGGKDPSERKVLLAPDPESLKKFMTTLAERYDGKIAAIEYLNEANLFITPKGLIEHYYKPVYSAMKKVAPDLPVLMNQTMDYAADGNGYTGQFLSQGGFDYSDGLTHHPYGASLLDNGGLPSAKTLEALARKYSRPDKPVILGMSEIHGIGDYSFLRGEPVQRALIDWSIGCRWSAGVLVAYTNFYEGTGPRKWLLRGAFAPGVGAAQMNGLYATLGGYQFKQRIELDDHVLIVAFEKSGEARKEAPRYAVALTAAKIPANQALLEADLDGLDIKAFDAYGEPVPFAGNRIALSQETLYLKSSSPELLSRLKAGRISWGQTLMQDVEEVKGPEAFNSIYRTGLPPMQRQPIDLIRQWLVLIDVPASPADSTPEKLGILDAQGRLAWPEDKTRTTKTPLPYVLLAGRPPSSGRDYYAYAVLQSDKDQEATLHLSSSGPSALWINGKAVSLKPDQDFGLAGASWQDVKVSLKEGINSLLIRVTSNGNPCAFALSANRTDHASTRPAIDEEGFIRAWKMIGPWKNPRNDDGEFLGNTKVYPPETKVDFQGFYSGMDDLPLIWSEEVSDKPIIVHPWINAVSYGHATVEVEQDTACTVSLGSDDGYALWINGELIGRRAISRALKIDDEKIPVTLKKGKNQILFKIEDTGGGGGFALRFLDDEGNPIVLKSAL